MNRPEFFFLKDRLVVQPTNWNMCFPFDFEIYYDYASVVAYWILFDIGAVD